MGFGVGAVVHDPPCAAGSNAGKRGQARLAGGVDINRVGAGTIGRAVAVQTLPDAGCNVIYFALGVGGGDFGVGGSLPRSGLDLFGCLRGLLLHLLVGLLVTAA